MNRKEVFDYALERYGDEPEYPWGDENAVLRHRENKKWYCLVMEIGADKLGLNGTGMVDVMNVKCEPLLIGSLRAQEGYHRAYHMNKDKWLTVRLDGSVPTEDIMSLIDLSYMLTGIKRGAKK